MVRPMVMSKTKHSKTKTEARNTQNSKTKHPKLENGAPKTRKRSTQISKTEHPKLENGAPKSRKRSTQKSKTKHPKLETCLSFKNTRQSLVKSPAAGIKHDNEENAVQNYSSRTTRCCKCISFALTIGHFGVA